MGFNGLTNKHRDIYTRGHIIIYTHYHTLIYTCIWLYMYTRIYGDFNGENDEPWTMTIKHRISEPRIFRGIGFAERTHWSFMILPELLLQQTYKAQQSCRFGWPPLSINPKLGTCRISTRFAGKWTINWLILGTINWRIMTHLTNVWLPQSPGGWSCSPKHCHIGCRLNGHTPWTKPEVAMSTCHPCEETYS